MKYIKILKLFLNILKYEKIKIDKNTQTKCIKTSKNKLIRIHKIKNNGLKFI